MTDYRQIDHDNLTFYAKLFEQNHWQTPIIAWNVFSTTLNEVAERILKFQEREICICAAVMADNGVVFRCHRHQNGFQAIHFAGLQPLSDAIAQGFVTSRGRFVSRKQARQLQETAGIKSVAPGGYRDNGELFSEDLY